MKDINYMELEFGNNETVIEYVKGLEIIGFDEEFESDLRAGDVNGKMFFSKSTKGLKFTVPDLTTNENIVKFIYNFISIFHFSVDVDRLTFKLKDFTVRYNEHNKGLDIDFKDKSVDSVLYHISILNMFHLKFYKYVDYSSKVFDFSVDVKNNQFVESSINLKMVSNLGIFEVEDGNVVKCVLDDNLVKAIDTLNTYYGVNLKPVIGGYLESIGKLKGKTLDTDIEAGSNAHLVAVLYFMLCDDSEIKLKDKENLKFFNEVRKFIPDFLIYPVAQTNFHITGDAIIEYVENADLYTLMQRSVKLYNTCQGKYSVRDNDGRIDVTTEWSGTVVEFEDAFELTEHNRELVIALSKNNNLPVTLVCGNTVEMYFNGERVNKI